MEERPDPKKMLINLARQGELLSRQLQSLTYEGESLESHGVEEGSNRLHEIKLHLIQLLQEIRTDLDSEIAEDFLLGKVEGYMQRLSTLSQHANQMFQEADQNSELFEEPVRALDAKDRIASNIRSINEMLRDMKGNPLFSENPIVYYAENPHPRTSINDIAIWAQDPNVSERNLEWFENMTDHTRLALFAEKARVNKLYDASVEKLDKGEVPIQEFKPSKSKGMELPTIKVTEESPWDKEKRQINHDKELARALPAPQEDVKRLEKQLQEAADAFLEFTKERKHLEEEINFLQKKHLASALLQKALPVLQSIKSSIVDPKLHIPEEKLSLYFDVVKTIDAALQQEAKRIAEEKVDAPDKAQAAALNLRKDINSRFQKYEGKTATPDVVPGIDALTAQLERIKAPTTPLPKIVPSPKKPPYLGRGGGSYGKDNNKPKVIPKTEKTENQVKLENQRKQLGLHYQKLQEEREAIAKERSRIEKEAAELRKQKLEEAKAQSKKQPPEEKKETDEQLKKREREFEKAKKEYETERLKLEKQNRELQEKLRQEELKRREEERTRELRAEQERHRKEYEERQKAIKDKKQKEEKPAVEGEKKTKKTTDETKNQEKKSIFADEHVDDKTKGKTPKKNSDLFGEDVDDKPKGQTPKKKEVDDNQFGENFPPNMEKDHSSSEEEASPKVEEPNEEVTAPTPPKKKNRKIHVSESEEEPKQEIKTDGPKKSKKVPVDKEETNEGVKKKKPKKVRKEKPKKVEESDESEIEEKPKKVTKEKPKKKKKKESSDSEESVAESSESESESGYTSGEWGSSSDDSSSDEEGSHKKKKKKSKDEDEESDEEKRPEDFYDEDLERELNDEDEEAEKISKPDRKIIAQHVHDEYFRFMSAATHYEKIANNAMKGQPGPAQEEQLKLAKRSCKDAIRRLEYYSHRINEFYHPDDPEKVERKTQIRQKIDSLKATINRIDEFRENIDNKVENPIGFYGAVGQWIIPKDKETLDEAITRVREKSSDVNTMVREGGIKQDPSIDALHQFEGKMKRARDIIMDNIYPPKKPAPPGPVIIESGIQSTDSEFTGGKKQALRILDPIKPTEHQSHSVFGSYGKREYFLVETIQRVDYDATGKNPQLTSEIFYNKKMLSQLSEDDYVVWAARWVKNAQLHNPGAPNAIEIYGNLPHKLAKNIILYCEKERIHVMNSVPGLTYIPSAQDKQEFAAMLTRNQSRIKTDVHMKPSDLKTTGFGKSDRELVDHLTAPKL